MIVYCDGGCRGNGQQGAFGAAAALVYNEKTRYWYRAHKLDPDDDEVPTNQRAEIKGIVFALQLALERINEELDGEEVNLTIRTDSGYAVNAMTIWTYTWMNNGWINSRGMSVANTDLFSEAIEAETGLNGLAKIKYEWVPRERNHEAIGSATS